MAQRLFGSNGMASGRRFIQPAVVGDISWVKAHHESPYGRIAELWQREADKLVLNEEIPPNTSATVHVPGGETHQVTSGKHRFEAILRL